MESKGGISLLLISIVIGFYLTNAQNCYNYNNSCNTCILNKRCVFVQTAKDVYTCILRQKTYPQIKRIFRTEDRCNYLADRLSTSSSTTITPPPKPSKSTTIAPSILDLSTVRSTTKSSLFTIKSTTTQKLIAITKASSLPTTQRLIITKETTLLPTPEILISTTDATWTVPKKEIIQTSSSPSLIEKQYSTKSNDSAFINTTHHHTTPTPTPHTTPENSSLNSTITNQTSPYPTVKSPETTDDYSSTVSSTQSTLSTSQLPPIIEITQPYPNTTTTNKPSTSKSSMVNPTVKIPRYTPRRVIRTLNQRQLTKKIKREACIILYLQTIYLYQGDLGDNGKWVRYYLQNPMVGKEEECKKLLGKKHIRI